MSLIKKSLSSKKDATIKERMAVIETLLNNHLHHHEVYLTFVLLPLLVASLIGAGGVVFVAVKLVLAKVI